MRRGRRAHRNAHGHRTLCRTHKITRAPSRPGSEGSPIPRAERLPGPVPSQDLTVRRGRQADRNPHGHRTLCQTHKVTQAPSRPGTENSPIPRARRLPDHPSGHNLTPRRGRQAHGNPHAHRPADHSAVRTAVKHSDGCASLSLRGRRYHTALVSAILIGGNPVALRSRCRSQSGGGAVPVPPSHDVGKVGICDR